MPSFSLNIVNFKTKKYLIELLKSVRGDLVSFTEPYEINILENASGDDLSDLKTIFNDLPLLISNSPKNVGFGGGHNILATKSTYTTIIIANPDAQIIEPETFKRLLEHLERDPLAAIIGPRLLTLEHNRFVRNEEAKELYREGKLLQQLWDHGDSFPIMANFADRLGIARFRQHKTPTKVNWVSGAFCAIRKNDFNEIGGFDESFFFYNEETDLSLRLRQQGRIILYDPSIYVAHFYNASLEHNSWKARYYRWTSFLPYWKKHLKKVV